MTSVNASPIQVHLERSLSEHAEAPGLTKNQKARLALIHEDLDAARIASEKHRERAKRLSASSTIIRAAINLLNTVSITSLALNTSDEMPAVRYLTWAATSVSALLSAASSAFALDAKASRDATSSHQLAYLHASFSNRVLRNNLTSAEYERLYDELSARMSLYRDSAEAL